jgi:hypothetical protein
MSTPPTRTDCARLWRRRGLRLLVVIHDPTFSRSRYPEAIETARFQGPCHRGMTGRPIGLRPRSSCQREYP